MAIVELSSYGRVMPIRSKAVGNVNWKLVVAFGNIVVAGSKCLGCILRTLKLTRPRPPQNLKNTKELTGAGRVERTVRQV